MQSKNFTIKLFPDKPPFDSQIMEKFSISGLNCGSGLSLNKEPWINTDLMPISDGENNRTSPDTIAYIQSIHDSSTYLFIEHDARYPYPFTDETFQWISSEHFIEHITPFQAVQWLKECFRLLKRGGVLRISTPDLELYMKGYLQWRNSFLLNHNKNVMEIFSQILKRGGIADHYVQDDLLAWMSAANPSASQEELQAMFQNSSDPSLILKCMQHNSTRPAFMINQAFRFWQHQWIYDFDELKFAAEKAGFNSKYMKKSSFGKGEIGQFDLPYRKDESLYVEIKKE